MDIHSGLLVKKGRSAMLAAIALSVIPLGTASAMGISGLIGVMPGFPQIDGTSVLDQGVSFTTFGAGSGQLTVTSTPNLYFSDAGSLDFISGGLFDLNAIIDSSGTSSASVVITFGSTTGGLGSPLLIADLIAFGLENTSANPGGTDRADFLLNPTGGSMLSDSNWVAGSQVGIAMTLEGSTYNGSLNESWEASRAKIVIGQLPVGLSEPTTLPLAVIGMAGLWFMGRRTERARR